MVKRMRGHVLFPLVPLLLFGVVACRDGTEGLPALRLESALGRVAYVRGGDIWAQELPDGRARRLTTDGRNSAPSWSPSGRWLSFYSEQALCTIEVDEGHELCVSTLGQPVQAIWSPVEDRLAYISPEGRLVIVEPDGTTWRTVVPGPSEGQPGRVERVAWRPDGQWLACQMAERSGSQFGSSPTQQVLCVVRADAPASASLYRETNPIETSIHLAGWSGDGKHVLFWRGPTSRSLQADGLELLSVAANGGEPRSLVQTMLPYADFVAPKAATSLLALVVGGGRESWRQTGAALALGDPALWPYTKWPSHREAGHRMACGAQTA